MAKEQSETAAACDALSMIHTFEAPRVTSNDGFGTGIALSQGRVFVNSIGARVGRRRVGQVYMYDAASGELLQTFDDPAEGRNNFFGQSLAVDADVIVISTPLYQERGRELGQVNIFDIATAEVILTLNNPDAADMVDLQKRNLFGWGLALDDTHVVVGSPGQIVGEDFPGRVYVFDRRTGELERRIDDPTPTQEDRFGYEVKIVGEHLWVSAWGDDTVSLNMGQIHRFNLETGELELTINDPTPEGRDLFGLPMTVREGLVAAAATFDYSRNGELGEVHVFDAKSGELLSTIVSPAGLGTADFGNGLAISGGRLLVGVRPQHGTREEFPGAYLYDIATGSLISEILDPRPRGLDAFGFSVQLDQNFAVIAAPSSGGRGHVHVYECGG